MARWNVYSKASILLNNPQGDKSPEIILTLKLIPRDLPQEVIRFAV
jgi:hypothetical protein